MLTWKINQTHPEIVSKLTNALSEITDPELGYSIIDLGLVRDIEQTEDAILITMILTTPYCPYGPSLMEAARKKVESTMGIETKIVYGKEAWEISMMDENLIDEDWGLIT